MAVAFDAVSSGETLGGGYGVDITHVIGAGSDRLLLVAVCFVYSENPRTGTAATYGGVSMTSMGEVNDNTTAVWWFKLVNPATGSDTVSVDFGGYSHRARVYAISFTGVHQTTPLGTSQTDTYPLSGLTCSSTAGDMAVDFIAASNVVTISVGAGQTQRGATGAADSSGPAGCSTEAATGASVTMSWSADAPYVSHVGVTVLASSATTEKLKLLVGSGAASATGVEGWVISDDSATYYGHFTGQTFEASLESGQAVLKVATSDISPDGATLTTSDTPLVVVRNTTYGTSMCDATVIEE